MIEQPLDISRSVQIIRRRLVAVCAVAGIGLLVGALYAELTPPPAMSSALVLLPPNARDASTQAIIAASQNVLTSAEQAAHTTMPLQDLRRRLKVTVLAPGVLSVQAKATTANQAERLANAVASSYIAYVTTVLVGRDRMAAQMLARATVASTGSRLARLLIWGGLGALAGALAAIVSVLAIGRLDRRLRLRDELASAIGAPVLASFSAWRATGARGWAKLLDCYQPKESEAWQLDSALRHLGLDLASVVTGGDTSACSVMVLSLTSDRRALALGPQLAAFAARKGIKTWLIIGPRQDVAATAALRAACGVFQPTPGRSGSLETFVADQRVPDRRSDASLTVLVATVDCAAPHLTRMMRTDATVLAVSSGAATADQLARVAAAGAADGRQIDGLLIADPDPADWTSGRIPGLFLSGKTRQPTRITDMPAASLTSTISQPVRTRR